MGELIKEIGELLINEKKTKVELNGPITREYGGIIHIHANGIRVDIKEGDFMSMASYLNLAKANLQRIKHLSEDKE